MRRKVDMNWRLLLVRTIQVAIIVLLFDLFYYLTSNVLISAVIAVVETGMITYLLKLCPKFYIKGVVLFKKERYEESIEMFEKAYKYFSRHVWMDRCRLFLFLSDSKETLREDALRGMANAYIQIGEIEKAKAVYDKLLKEFPNNEAALTEKILIDAIQGDIINR